MAYFYYLIITIIYLNFNNIYSSSLLNTFSKSLYASIKEDKNLNLQNIRSNSKINSIDYLIMKYENSLDNFKG